RLYLLDRNHAGQPGPADASAFDRRRLGPGHPSRAGSVDPDVAADAHPVRADHLRAEADLSLDERDVHARDGGLAAKGSLSESVFLHPAQRDLFRFLVAPGSPAELAFAGTGSHG